MKELLLYLWSHNFNSARRLSNDLPDERLAEQPAGIRNHAAWTLGHLSVGADYALQFLKRPTHADAWKAKCDYGSTPTDRRSDYPSKSELLGMLEAQQVRVAQAVEADFESTLNVAMPVAELKTDYPTVDRFVAYLLSNHPSYHLGQLTAWRRAMGLSK